MIDDTESIIQGETFRLGVTVRLSEDDGGLVDADLVVFDENNAIVIENTAAFQQNTDDETEYESDLSTSNTDVTPGTYKYFVRINWDDGSNDVIPDKTCVDSGECEYMELIICEKPTTPVVS